LVGPTGGINRTESYHENYIKSDAVTLHKSLEKMYNTDFVTKSQIGDQMLSADDRIEL